MTLPHPPRPKAWTLVYQDRTRPQVTQKIKHPKAVRRRSPPPKFYKMKDPLWRLRPQRKCHIRGTSYRAQGSQEVNPFRASSQTPCFQGENSKSQRVVVAHSVTNQVSCRARPTNLGSGCQSVPGPFLLHHKKEQTVANKVSEYLARYYYLTRKNKILHLN